jgi:hypothetical protein
MADIDISPQNHAAVFKMEESGIKVCVLADGNVSFVAHRGETRVP